MYEILLGKPCVIYEMLLRELCVCVMYEMLPGGRACDV